MPAIWSERAGSIAHLPERAHPADGSIRPDVDARDVILLIGYLTRLDQDEWDTRARHLLQVILDGLHQSEPGPEQARGR